jgi:hypothetical protein
MEPNEKHPVPVDPSVTVEQVPSLTKRVIDDVTERQDEVALKKTKTRSLADIPLLQAPGYEIQRKLGEGTYGEVWLAEEVKTGIRVAIKFFAHGTGQQWQLLQTEVKQLALLHADPGIIQLEDVNPDASPPYYVMAYAEGGSLANRLEKGPLPLKEAVRIFRQVAGALAYVHAKGVRHCDLKPGNVLLDGCGRPLVADFGQAHLSCDASPALGTFFYMAPEQADLERQIPDTRWDVYGLGALLYAMLTGQPPREDLGLRDELAATVELPHRLRRYREAVQRLPRLTAHRRLPGMDRALAEVIDRCLDLDPKRRYRDAGTVLEALDRRAQQRRRRPILVFGAVVTALLLVGMAGLAGGIFTQARKEIGEQVRGRFKDHDQMRAEHIASVVEDKLGRRIDFIEHLAQDPGLVRALKEGNESELHHILDTSHEQSRGDLHFFWVTDIQGKLRAVYPDPPKKRTDRLDYRDWFSGGGDKRVQPEPYPPIEKSYISQPFKSKLRGQAMIAISTPVRDGDHILGVLAGSMALEKVHEWFADVKMEKSFPVILNERGHYLFHGREDEDHKIEPPEPDSRQKPRGVSPNDEPYHKLLIERKTGSTTEPLLDNFDHKPYWAGYAPLSDEKLGWGVLIQHDPGAIQEAVAHSVENFDRFMRQITLTAAAFLGVLIPGLWAWLIWKLRHGEQVAHG